MMKMVKIRKKPSFHVKNPKSDDFLYVTVDGNRRITLTEVSDREHYRY